ncbi:MAG: N-acetylmuramoyl-L-alanine amidase [bacterium]|nr:N-acetylmuramoyl-L-alanine amidase [bacterium]
MKYRPFIITLFFVAFLFVGMRTTQTDRNMLAALVFPERITPEELHEKYGAPGKKINILIVPGHDQEASGTEHGSLRELDLNLALGKHLHTLLEDDDRFRVFLTQDASGYTPIFEAYFMLQKNAIKEFIRTFKQLMYTATQGGFEKKSVVQHNAVSKDISLKLYGMNKWANENKIDIAVHIHFNDYPGRPWGRVGKYTGFSIYVPEKQLPNARASQDVAKSVFVQLKKALPVTNYKKESAGIVEDQELIAVGSYATLDAASLLIEYGYIYESQFNNERIRDDVMKELAYHTYAGLVRYFDPRANLAAHDTSLLPYQWNDVLELGDKGEKDVLALQVALNRDGVYPPDGKTFNDCPLSGNFLTCTKEAVVAFQKKYLGAQMGTGTVGFSTINILNKLYGFGNVVESNFPLYGHETF